MHRFAFRKGQLYCEDLPVAEVAERLGTPLYVYSYRTILDHFLKLKVAFRSIKPLICYAVKANANGAILRALVKAGAGFDVVSGGELAQVLRAGADPKKIVFASVGKTTQEIEQAMKARILFFNVESIQEMERIDEVAQRLKYRQAVSLRLNPDVDPETHTYIATGKKASKFGMDVRTVEALLKRHRDFPYLTIRGMHVHIGSQILKAKPFQEAIRRALNLIGQARKGGANLRWLNLGGGLGIVYHRELPQTAQDFARSVLPLLKESGLHVILEPGRFIVGNSGVLLTRVLYEKESHGKRFTVVDAGMNDLIRPSLYGAYHEILPVNLGSAVSRKRVKTHIVGPICESSDFLAKDRSFPRVKPGSLLAVFGAGAYGFSMASNYNFRPRPAEAMVKENRWYLIRRRERIEDLTRGEQIPHFLR